MIAVSPVNRDRSKGISRSGDGKLECGPVVGKPQDFVPNARNLVVVKEARSGDGGGRDGVIQNVP